VNVIPPDKRIVGRLKCDLRRIALWLSPNPIATDTLTLTIRAERDRSDLVIAVENSSPSSPSSERPAGFGIGIANVRKRLAALYGDKAGLECAPRPGGGWLNLVRIPWMERSNDAGIAG
jgi:LytS/YehU family sensor histidine kinase